MGSVSSEMQIYIPILNKLLRAVTDMRIEID
jgi:hypothetical protein